jgi:hypothetical protein
LERGRSFAMKVEEMVVSPYLVIVDSGFSRLSLFTRVVAKLFHLDQISPRCLFVA